MKLHLPKGLLTAVLAVVSASTFSCGVAHGALTTTTIKYDAEGNVIPDSDTTTPVADTVVVDQYNGSGNGKIDIDRSPDVDKIIFNMEGGSNTNWFEAATRTALFAGDVQIGADGSDGTTGLIINDCSDDINQTFSGKVTGDGVISYKKNSNRVVFRFSGDATEYTGNMDLCATGGSFTLAFGGSTAAAAPTSSTAAGVAGTGAITFKSTQSSTLEFNYSAAETPVYITNDISEEGDNCSSSINLKGGANYIFTKTAAVDSVNIASNTTWTISDYRKFSAEGAVYGDGTLIVSDGGTAEIAAEKAVKSHIKVTGGGTLKSTVVDGTWYQSGAATKSITLKGSSTAKLAKFEVTERQTYITKTYMDGYSEICGTGSLQLFSGAHFVVSGTSNTISAALTTSRASIFEVEENGILEISGQVTRNGSNVENDTFTKKGAGELIFSHNANSLAGGLIIENGTVTIKEGGKVSIYDTVVNNGTLNINGTLDIAGMTSSKYLYGDLSFVTKPSNGTSSANGYAQSNQVILAQGNVVIGEGGSVTGVQDYDLIEGTGLVGTMGNAIVDTTRFYVNEDTVKVGDATYSDKTATTYIVATGATLDMNGQNFAGKSIILNGDSKLTNTGRGYGDNDQLIDKITLTGNAEVNIDSDHNHGLTAWGWGPSSLELGSNILTKTGDGLFRMVNTTVNGSGIISVQGGKVYIGTVNASDKNVSAGGVTFKTGANGTLEMVNGADLIAKAVEGEGGKITGAAGTTLQLESTGSHTYSGSVEGGFSLVKKGSGTQTFAGNTALGAVTLEAGTLEIGGTASSVSGVISGSGSLKKIGSGTLTFSKANTYSGDTTIDGGTLKLDLGYTQTTTGEGEDAVTTQTNTTYTLGGKVTGSGTLQVEAGTTLVSNGKEVSSALVLNGGNVTVSAGEKMFSANSVTLKDGSRLTFTAGDSVNYDNTAAYIWKVESGATLDFANTRQAFTTGSILELAGGTITGSGDAYGAVDMKDYATLTIKATADSDLAATVRLRDGASIMFNVAENTTLTMSGLLVNRDPSDASKKGAFTKTGAGTLVLSGDNTYSGGTTIEQGILALSGNGTLGTGLVTIKKDGTLKTNGSAATMTVTGAGAIDLGNTTALNATLDNNWTGTVKLSGAKLADADLNTYGNANSTVQLNSSTGSLKAGDVNTKVELKGAPAFKVTETTGKTVTFNNAISGDANFVVEATGDGANTGTDTYVFKGDVSNWKKAADANQDVGFIAASDTIVRYEGNATTINHGIYANAGKLDATIGGENAVTVNGDISNRKWTDSKGELNLTVANSSATGVTFNNAVKADSITVNSNSKATFNNQAEATALTVGEKATATFTQGTVKLTNVTLEKDSSMTAANLTIAEGGTLIFGNGALLTVTGSLTLDVNSIKLADGFEFATTAPQQLISQTGNLTAEAVASWNGGEYVVGGKTCTAGLSMKDGGLYLTLNEVPSKDFVITSVVETFKVEGVEQYMYTPEGTSLTLNVTAGSLAGLKEGGLVELGLISEGMKQALLQDKRLDSDEVTLFLSDGTRTIEAGKDAIVGFYNEDHKGYWGKLVGSNRVYEIDRIPEPTTGALSLLALCGLAARRRRRA